MSRALLSFLLLVPLLVPLVAGAVEKCVDANGKISYLDICPPGSTRAPAKTDERLIPKPGAGTTVIQPEFKPTPEPSSGPVKVEPIPAPPSPPAPPPAPAAGPAPAAPAPAAAAPPTAPAETVAPVLPAVLPAAPADVQLTYYDVEGTDQASLIAALNARGAAQGQASWKLSYQYVPRRNARQCVVGKVTTKLELGMTLPRWAPPAGTSPELIGRWERFLKTLIAHQNARLDHARELERSLGPALAALEPARDCAALDAAVKARYAELEEHTKARAQEPATEIVFE